ncbi:glycosyltransferase [Opitutus terrae]|uniref:Glycosyl transferase family 2 n=1 Tax=Opitutus terrae (strain DSM 11246 / JCM 15787 / PB90-1) TaxID=452637 RepID=B1ZT79_OPITP|nr:glycosyltransferase [Opitutus terrae]ACB76533.1 glycosyl transferase family 2 [Opitutus terrae PB90-1]
MSQSHAFPSWILPDWRCPAQHAAGSADAASRDASSRAGPPAAEFHSSREWGRADSSLDLSSALASTDGRRIRTSVLVNTHNHARFIEECIDSLLVQTVQPDEIIVYDDASTDDTPERLRRYGNRIVLIQGQAGEGPGYVRQAHAIFTAFRHSTGQLIFLLDGDDRFKRTKIEHYVNAYAVNPDAVLVQSPMDKIDEHGRIIGSNREPRKHVVEHLKAIYREQDVDFYYPTSSLAFARSFLLSTLPVDLSDGLALWTDTRLSVIAPYFGRVLTLPEAWAEWRRHGGSDSLRVRSRRLQLQQTWMRTEVFNRFCRRHGLRTISTWRNGRFYLQLLRFSLPEGAYHLFQRRLRRRLTRAWQV